MNKIIVLFVLLVAGIPALAADWDVLQSVPMTGTYATNDPVGVAANGGISNIYYTAQDLYVYELDQTTGASTQVFEIHKPPAINCTNFPQYCPAQIGGVEYEDFIAFYVGGLDTSGKARIFVADYLTCEVMSSYATSAPDNTLITALAYDFNAGLVYYSWDEAQADSVELAAGLPGESLELFEAGHLSGVAWNNYTGCFYFSGIDEAAFSHQMIGHAASAPTTGTDEKELARTFATAASDVVHGYSGLPADYHFVWYATGHTFYKREVPGDCTPASTFLYALVRCENDGDQATIRWMTAREKAGATDVVDHFTVLRSTSPSGPWTDVSGDIAPHGPDQMYEWVDSSPLTMPWYYRVRATWNTAFEEDKPADGVPSRCQS